MFCVLYTAIVEPLKVAYLVDIFPDADTFLDVFFVLDIFVQCFCGFPEAGGGSRFPVMDFRTVFATYCKTWFAIDLIAAVPFDRFTSTNTTSVAVRLPGLIKTVRLLKLKRIMRKWNALSIGPVLKVGTVLLMWMLSAHWFACVFFMIGWYGCNSYEHTWITVYWPEMSSAVRTPPLVLCSIAHSRSASAPSTEPILILPSHTPCASHASHASRTSHASEALPPLLDRAQCHTPGSHPDPALITLSTSNYNADNTQTQFSIHIRCMYWVIATMSSIGYARAPKSVNDIEYAYAMLTQVIGACLAAAIFSNVASMLNKGDQVSSRYQGQLDRVTVFCQMSKLKGPLRKKLLGYSELLFSVSRGYDTSAIASIFPPLLQEDIFHGVHIDDLKRLPLFQLPELNQLFFQRLATKLKQHVLIDGDPVYRVGEPADRAYFLRKGYVHLGDTKRLNIFATHGPGSHFSQASLLQDKKSKDAKKHTTAAWSLCDCIIYSLADKDLRATLERIDDDRSTLLRKMTGFARSFEPAGQRTLGVGHPAAQASRSALAVARSRLNQAKTRIDQSRGVAAGIFTRRSDKTREE